MLSLANCGGGSGSGSGGAGGDDENGGPEPPLPTTVTILGVASAQTSGLPLSQAVCRFVDALSGQQLTATTASGTGTFELAVLPDRQGLIRCSPPSLPGLTLSAFVSTVGQSAGSTIANEQVTTATTVIVDILTATSPEDPQARKQQLLADLAAGEPHLTTLVDAATLLYERLLAAQIDVDAGFGGESGEGDGDAGDADGGGVEGEAGDGGEFSPIADAVCEFTLDPEGMIGAHTALADLFADGRVDQTALQPIADQVHAILNSERRRAIRTAFPELFPNGLGQALHTTAAGRNAARPGGFFLSPPTGMPGVIRCHPPDQANLVLTTCVRARAPQEVLLDENVSPRTTVVCDLLTEVQQADVSADREAIKVDLLSRLEALRIFLSEDRNGNGMADPDEEDEDGDGVISTVVRIESDAAIDEEDRDLALLVSTATTIFDTMRIERPNLPPERTFGEARREFFTNGNFSAPLAPLAPGVGNALQDVTNQAVLGSNDVVRAATRGTLRGTVTDEDGSPLAGVQVVVRQNGEEVDVEGNPAITDSDGRFRIRNIPVGETTVTAFLNGFAVLNITTAVVAIVTIDVVLLPTPAIDVRPSFLAFGEVLVGETSALPVTIVNTGAADLILSMLRLEPPNTPHFSFSQTPMRPVIVSSGAPVTLELLYRPATVGPAVGRLRITSNAVNASEIIVLLSGTGLPVPVPLLEVDPVTLAFGEVVVGKDRTRTLTLRNPGTADLHLRDIVISNPAAFSLPPPALLPMTLAPGTTEAIEVTFAPPTDELFTGTLILRSDATNAPEVIVDLRGTGIPVTGSTGSTGGTN